MREHAKIAAEFGLVRRRRCWRGNCPACQGKRTLVLSLPRADLVVRMFCENCKDSAVILPEPLNPMETNDA
jgi:hypothetical protein